MVGFPKCCLSPSYAWAAVWSLGQCFWLFWEICFICFPITPQALGLPLRDGLSVYITSIPNSTLHSPATLPHIALWSKCCSPFSAQNNPPAFAFTQFQPISKQHFYLTLPTRPPWNRQRWLFCRCSGSLKMESWSQASWISCLEFPPTFSQTSLGSWDGLQTPRVSKALRAIALTHPAK